MTKKKRLAFIISTVILVLLIIGASAFVYACEVTKKNSIGLDKALNIAMIDAGVTEENAVVTKAKMDYEKGIFVYDIEFNANGTDEYDYSIKASDGTILKRDLDADYEDDAVVTEAETQKAEGQISSSVNTTALTQIQQTSTASTTQKPSENTTEASSSVKQTTQKTTALQTTEKSSSNITLEAAKAIAFNDSGVSKNDASIISAHKETDDGISYYDIEFKASSYKYEYEIDLNGKIISYDKEKIIAKQTTKKTTTAVTASSNSSKYIGVDKAKQVALNNAGLSSDSVTFKKAKLEKDDGVYQYEIEFITSTTEYEYDIDAVSGKIISHSSEPLDDD
ncbi:MAG: PepSY domain-containing protein [Eubacterium sp.]